MIKKFCASYFLSGLLGCASLSSQSPASLCSEVPVLAAEVAKIRKLPLKDPIKCLELSREEYIAHKQKDYLTDENPDRLAAEEIAYKQIGLIPESYNYQSCLAESYTDNLMASYDSSLKAILLPAGGNIDRSILAHEIVHALQDQHFSLGNLQKVANRSSDSALALAALVEGDALLVQESFPVVRTAAEEVPEQTAPSACAPPLGLDLQFDFPYGYGLIYAKRLSANPESNALDLGLSNPPRCTAAIIHKKFPSSECPDWHKLSISATERAWLVNQLGPSPRERFTESLGEFTLGLLLSPELGRQKAILAAKGWAGDKLVLWQGTDKHATSLVTQWDTPENAREFANYFAKLTFKNKPLVAVERTRVSLFFGPG